MGVATTTSAYCCLNLQQSLDAIVGNLAPDKIMEGMGFFNALTSPVNRDGFQAVQTKEFAGKARPQSGSLPKIEIIYEKPQCESVETSVAGMCANHADRGDSFGYLVADVDYVYAKAGEFTKDDFGQLCEAPNERLAKLIRKDALDLKRAINKKLIQLAYALTGNYSNGDSSQGATAKMINLLNGSGHINPAAMALVKSEFRKMHVEGSPIFVGGDILGLWMDTKMMGGLGANAIGADSNAFAGGVNMFLDYHLDAEVQTLESDTESHAIAWMPGAFQLLEWFKNTGYNEEFKEDYTETTITIDGIQFDYTLYYDACNHKWKWELSKYFDLFAIPDAAYNSCWDFNHRLHFELGCGDFNCTNYGLSGQAV